MKTLKKGDHIRVVSPSSSIERIGGFGQGKIGRPGLQTLFLRTLF